MIDRLTIANARAVSGRDFFNAITGRRTPEEQANRIRLAREHRDAIQASYALPHEEGMKVRERLSAEFAALVKAGETAPMVFPDRSPLEELADEALAEVRLQDRVDRELKRTIELNQRRYG
jgi:hypothetical protein